MPAFRVRPAFIKFLTSLCPSAVKGGSGSRAVKMTLEQADRMDQWPVKKMADLPESEVIRTNYARGVIHSTATH